MSHWHLEHTVDTHDVFHCFVLKDHVYVALKLHILFERIHFLLKFFPQSLLIHVSLLAIHQTGEYDGTSKCFVQIEIAEVLLEQVFEDLLDILLVVRFCHPVLPEP